jgi:hypothetical protein
MFNRLDREGVWWRLRTLRDLLHSYATHAIPEMLAPDGARCGPYTRSVLRRRPIRDGERWLLLKEAAFYGDDPSHAFSLTPPEPFRRAAQAEQGRDAEMTWDGALRRALTIVAPAMVARRLGLAVRTARAWAAGARRPEKPGDVVRAIIAIGTRLGSACRPASIRAQEICSELPRRAIAVQAFIVITAATLAERHGGVRALTRANTALGATKRLVRLLSLHFSLLPGSAMLGDPVRRTSPPPRSPRKRGWARSSWVL